MWRCEITCFSVLPELHQLPKMQPWWGFLVAGGFCTHRHPPSLQLVWARFCPPHLQSCSSISSNLNLRYLTKPLLCPADGWPLLMPDLNTWIKTKEDVVASQSWHDCLVHKPEVPFCSWWGLALYDCSTWPCWLDSHPDTFSGLSCISLQFRRHPVYQPSSAQ